MNESCHQHSWNGTYRCPDCYREAKAKAEAEERAVILAKAQKESHERDRWWVLKDLLIAALPTAMTGCWNNPTDISVATEFAMASAKAALALLDTETPEHMK